MAFFNREQEKKELKALLSGEPNLVWFVYGPINSGKTALIMKVIEELPEDYCVFYINFRWRDVRSVEDLTKVLFRVKRGKISEKTRDFIKETLKGGAKVLGKLKGIPIPENIFDVLFRSTDKVEDVFAFLEEYFEEIKKERFQPVLILDEMQMVKDVVNATGKSVLAGLFNFLVGMTKEKHLCHVLCATSDCLFIEDIYANARLEGRSGYFLVDDLEREQAFEIYESYGLKEKELLWEYIGGKVGDIVRVHEEKKRGLGEEEILKRLLKNTIVKLRWMLDLIEEGMKEGPPVEDIKKILQQFIDEREKLYVEVKGKVLKFLIEENVLFYNPLTETVRPQSQLLLKAIQEITKGGF